MVMFIHSEFIQTLKRNSSGKDPEDFNWGSVSTPRCVNYGQRQEVIFCEYVCFHLLVQEMQVQSLGQEDPLEKEMATHSSILAWKIPQTEEPGGVQSMRSQRVGHCE